MIVEDSKFTGLNDIRVTQTGDATGEINGPFQKQLHPALENAR